MSFISGETKIKSPINYTGNKYRILNQIQKYFPNKIKIMMDLFCGGATVGINTYCEKVFFVDSNERVINLLKYLANCNFDKFLTDVEKLIKQYHLSYSGKMNYSYYKKELFGNPNNGLKEINAEGFYALRNDYNSLKNKNTNKANLLLYILMVYAFNNDIRFSSSGFFNLPVGKTDFNRNNIVKVEDYIKKVSTMNYEFINSSFNSNEVMELLDIVDFVYMDPPYLITRAVYNENNGWTEELEYELLDFLDILIQKNKSFVLSNVLEKRGKKNEPLSYWIRLHKDIINVVDIDYHYRSSNYHKKDRNSHEREVILVFKGDSYND